MIEDDPSSRRGPGLSDAQLIDWIRLARSEGIGPRSFRTLLNRCGGAAAAVEALPELNARAGRVVRICTVAEAEAEFERTLRLGGRIVASGDPDYPRLLRAVDPVPPLVTIMGRIELFRMPSVGIVGSRNASAVGLRMAELLGRDLGRAGFVTVSGLARGIDTAVHRTTLDTGTIAVLAGGLDRPYPPENVGLLEKIAERGAVITEMPLGQVPRGRDFPRRNRIVSGLSYGVVVIEAALRSGSLITARFAAEQGRDVFAVPGSPLDPRAEGTNGLIRDGATLVTAAEQIVEVLAPQLGRDDFGSPASEDPGRPPDEPLWDEYLFDFDEEPRAAVRETGNPPPVASSEEDEEENAAAPAGDFVRVTALMGPAPIGVDDLARASGLDARAVRGILVELELAGRLVRHGGQRVSLLPPLS